MKILNIYGQEAWHTEAKIIGNREGLLQLRATIDKALQEGKATTPDDPSAGSPLFASDGEGYEVRVEMHNDGWGLKGGKDSFWNKEESEPQYIMMECENRMLDIRRAE
ncbi:MAG: hypothetical protein PHQ43_04290 [Dehalococcoidales bacterium]|nr:hypothetical protein [Dehalococcoidales bacterium]